MTIRLSILAGACALALTACGAPSSTEAPVPGSSIDASADWHLVSEESRLTFVSTKADELAEYGVSAFKYSIRTRIRLLFKC